MPATALAAAIRAKKLSPVELVRAVLARLDETNDRINAFCTLTEEDATRAARQAENAVMRGDRLGILHGLPVSIKDLLLTRGVRTMSGSRTREKYVAEDRKSTRLNSSHTVISYAVFCLKKKNETISFG